MCRKLARWANTKVRVCGKLRRWASIKVSVCEKAAWWAARRVRVCGKPGEKGSIVVRVCRKLGEKGSIVSLCLKPDVKRCRKVGTSSTLLEWTIIFGQLELLKHFSVFIFSVS